MPMIQALRRTSEFTVGLAYTATVNVRKQSWTMWLTFMGEVPTLGFFLKPLRDEAVFILCGYSFH